MPPKNFLQSFGGRRTSNRSRGAVGGGGLGGGTGPGLRGTGGGASLSQLLNSLIGAADYIKQSQVEAADDQEERVNKQKTILMLEDMGIPNPELLVNNLGVAEVTKQLLPDVAAQLKGKMNASALSPLFKQNQGSDLPDFEEGTTDLGTKFVDDGTGQQQGIRGLKLGPMNVEGQNKSILQNLVEQATSQTQIGNALTSQQLLKMSPEEREEALALQAKNLTSIAEQNKAIQNARTMFGQLGVNESNNALVNFIRRETGLLGQGKAPFVTDDAQKTLDVLNVPGEIDTELLDIAKILGVPQIDSQFIIQNMAQARDRVQAFEISKITAEAQARAQAEMALPITDPSVLNKFSNEAGEHPPVGTTGIELSSGKWYALSPQMMKNMDGVKATDATLSEMLRLGKEVFAKAPDGNQFTQLISGFGRKMWQVARGGAAAVSGRDGAFANYNSFRIGLLATIKKLTDDDRLSDNDAQRMLANIPSPYSNIAQQDFIERMGRLDAIMRAKLPGFVTNLTRTQKKETQIKKIEKKYGSTGAPQ